MREKRFCPYCAHRLIKREIEGRMRDHCNSCSATLYENPVPAACIVAVDTKNRVLLVKRNIAPKMGYWCLPGGFMETGETPEEAALREFSEETGLFGKIDMLLGVMTNAGTVYKTILMTGFLVRSFSGTPKAGDDAEEVGWFDRDQLPEIAFDSHASFIDIYYAAYSG